MARKVKKGSKSGKVSINDSVLVVGAGIGGIRASLDLAEAGYQVTLIEQQPNIGGVLMQLDRQFPTNDCGICKMLPTMMRDDISECCLRRNLEHPNIVVHTNSTLKKVVGDVGKFTIDIKQKPQFITPEKCILCGKCEEVCPVDVPNEFNDNLNTRKAIFTPYPLPNPNRYTLDIENCTKCGKCVEICPTNAIDLKAKEIDFQVKAGSVILAPGLHVFNPEPQKAYGYRTNPNILTSIDFERIYSGIGPYPNGRKLVRPSDKEEPKNIAFIQCVGSRNAQIGHEYCSYACCMYSLKEAILAKEQNPKIDVTIFYMDMRAFGKGYHEYYQKAKDIGIKFVRCRAPAVQSKTDSYNLEVSIVTESGEIQSLEFELVVLAVGLEAPNSARQLADVFGIELNEDNFNISDDLAPLATSRPGVYVCGAFTGPKDIPETVTEASAAAALASQHLGRITSMSNATTDDEIATRDSSTNNIGFEEPHIGIILCSCGTELEGKIDFKELEEFANQLTDVDFVETYEYLCLKPEEIIKQLGSSSVDINRLIIAACTPYHLEVKFKNYAKQIGLNPSQVDLIDLRERFVWACDGDKSLLTNAAKQQLAIVYEKLYTKNKLPQDTSLTQVTHRALVLGGGVAGMMSAITIAESGFFVDLIEKSESLGGNLKDIYSTLTQEDTQLFLNNMIKKIENYNNINVHLNSKIKSVSGFVGNFQIAFETNGNSQKPMQFQQYGAIVLATGAKQYEPTEYLYGKESRVITQLELERALAGKPLEDKSKQQTVKDLSKLKTLVMIQCVGSRNSDHPYCSRVCCAKAINNAIKLKKRNPEIKIYIIYQDIMTYGLQEKYYLDARESGIEFVRYEPKTPPELKKNKKNDKLLLKIKDELLNQELNLIPDLLVLSTGIVPDTHGLEVFQDIGLEYTHTNFLKEANVKFRPVDMLVDGIFIAGLIHSPRQLSESIVQAQAAAGRAITVLNKPSLPIRRNVSEVNTRRCSGCEVCITACPYHARIMDPDEKVAMVIETLCQGCGVCAMVCPNSATRMRGLQNEQIFSMIDTAAD